MSNPTVAGLPSDVNMNQAQISATDEMEVRQRIEAIIGHWDTAYVSQDVHGLLGHYVPDTAEEGKSRQQWSLVFACSKFLESKSVIRDFILADNQAMVTIASERRWTFREPDAGCNHFGLWVLRLMEGFAFVEQEVCLLTWIKTVEGWLCQSEKVLSSKVRLRRR